MTDFEGQVLGDLQVLKAQMEQIMGIGQPGRLHDLEHRVASAERSVQRMRGFVAAFGVLLTVIEAAINYLAGKH
jgi:hypothetical protein